MLTTVFTELALARHHEVLREAEQLRRARRLVAVRRTQRRADRANARAWRAASDVW